MIYVRVQDLEFRYCLTRATGTLISQMNPNLLKIPNSFLDREEEARPSQLKSNAANQMGSFGSLCPMNRIGRIPSATVCDMCNFFGSSLRMDGSARLEINSMREGGGKRNGTERNETRSKKCVRGLAPKLGPLRYLRIG